jgi:hypothetical protein
VPADLPEKQAGADEKKRGDGTNNRTGRPEGRIEEEVRQNAPPGKPLNNLLEPVLFVQWKSRDRRRESGEDASLALAGKGSKGANLTGVGPHPKESPFCSKEIDQRSAGTEVKRSSVRNRAEARRTDGSSTHERPKILSPATPAARGKRPAWWTRPGSRGDRPWQRSSNRP